MSQTRSATQSKNPVDISTFVEDDADSAHFFFGVPECVLPPPRCVMIEAGEPRLLFSGKVETHLLTEVANGQTTVAHVEVVDPALEGAAPATATVIESSGGLTKGVDFSVETITDEPTGGTAFRVVPLTPEAGRARQGTLILKVGSPKLLVPIKVLIRIIDDQVVKTALYTTPVGGDKAIGDNVLTQLTKGSKLDIDTDTMTNEGLRERRKDVTRIVNTVRGEVLGQALADLGEKIIGASLSALQAIAKGTLGAVVKELRKDLQNLGKAAVKDQLTALFEKFQIIIQAGKSNILDVAVDGKVVTIIDRATGDAVVVVEGTIKPEGGSQRDVSERFPGKVNPNTGLVEIDTSSMNTVH